MRQPVFLVLFSLVMCAGASGQRSLGYWFAAPGGVTAAGHSTFTIHLGGGGEFALRKGFTAGIEGGAVGPTTEYTRNVMGVGSLNGYYHFRHSRTAQLDPFVTGGYSLFFRHGTANLGNFGGGLNYWFLPTVALRTEFRDHVTGGPLRIHYWGLRLGLSFSAFEP